MWSEPPGSRADVGRSRSRGHFEGQVTVTAGLDGQSENVPLGDGGDDAGLVPALQRSRIRDDARVARGRELMAVAQQGDDAQRRAATAEADELLRQARDEGNPYVVAELLRTASITRLVTPGGLDEVGTTLDELLEHARAHRLIVAEADAHALRANRMFRRNPEDHVVLDELANALAILEQEWPASPTLDATEWAEQVARALSDTAIVLHHLDIHEMAATLLARGQRYLEITGEQHSMVVLLFNRVRSLLLWGLQFERTGQPDQAARQFEAAAVLADEVEEHWRGHLFPDRANQRAADQVVVFAVAFALHRPGSEHLDRLAMLRERSVFPDDPILLDIAQARCLNAVGRHDEAVTLLEKYPHENDPVDKAEPAVRLSLVREIARLDRRSAASEDGVWQRYIDSLEAGLLSLQRARVSALRARIEHATLSRQHRMLALQALQDPLTGLPNRRALEQQLDALVTAHPGEPIAIAMMDLDGFKQINDRYSHAVGDAVLVAIAGTLRRLLRVTDLIGRYGGDEFVVLLPSSSLPTAAAVLDRAVSQVSALPHDQARGVTVSVGVTAVGQTDSAHTALARADEAMYAAKRLGGARVVAAR